MRLPHTEVVGELKEREEARDTYDQAIARSFQAAVAEQDRPEVFTLSVGNIPPGQNVQINTLGERDRFLVLHFDTWTVRLGPSRKLEWATDRNRARVVQQLSGVKADGGTELIRAILEGLTHLSPYRGEGDCHLVLVTDGQVRGS